MKIIKRVIMKILLILILLLSIFFIILHLFSLKSQKNIEKYNYTIKKKYSLFEIRKYDETLFTSVKLPTKEYKKASSKGFSILAGYIFGDNKKNEKISMTSPVIMSLEDSITMMFMAPKKFRKESLPQPNQSQIKFKKEPSKTIAAISFGGWANDKKIEMYKEKLKLALDQEGITYINHFYFMGYNPPFELFNRKNEIAVEITEGFLDSE